MKAVIVMLAGVVAGLFLWSHWPSTDYAALADARDKNAQRKKGDIVIAAVMDADRSDFVNGIRLAVDQLNCEDTAHIADCKTLLGRRVTLRVEQATDDPQDDMRLVDEFVRDERIVAVLGHRKSAVALPASIVYEASRVIFMPSFATTKRLTGHDFQYVFRMAPNNPVMAEQFASVAEVLGYGRVAILHTRDNYSRELAFLFEDAAESRDIKIVQRSSFQASDEDYRGLIAQLRAKQFDAVFLAANTIAGIRMARQLRELGVHTPILGSDNLEASEFVKHDDVSNIDGIVMPALYHEDQPGSRQDRFVESFKAAYGHPPDATAAQGYDSMILLANAIKTAGTTRSSAVSSALHFMPFWLGVTGLHAFDQRGELLAKHYQFQVWHEGQWYPLPGPQWRYLLERTAESLQRDGDVLTAQRVMSTKHNRPVPSKEEQQHLQFDLARHILKWQRLGVILALDEDDREDSLQKHFPALTDLQDQKVETCSVHKGTAQADLTECLKTLSDRVEALMLARFDHLGPLDAKSVEASLRSVHLPVFALNSLDTEAAPPGLTFYIDVDDHEADFESDVQSFIQFKLVPHQAIKATRNLMSGLAVIKADLQDLQDLGIQRSAVLLNLFVHELPPAAPRVHAGVLADASGSRSATAASAPASAASVSQPPQSAGPPASLAPVQRAP